MPIDDKVRLPSTARVYHQFNALSCCAHAVSAGIETWMVAHSHALPVEELVDAKAVFSAGGDDKDLSVACAVAEKGVATPRGLEKAKTTFLGPAEPETMRAYLSDGMPLLIEVNVGSNFTQFPEKNIYRAVGPRMLHAVCVVGFGRDISIGEDYWIAKNSYGYSWGDQGYVRFCVNDKLVKPEDSVYAIRSVIP